MAFGLLLCRAHAGLCHLVLVNFAKSEHGDRLGQTEKIAGACVDECCASPALVLPQSQSVDRPALVREALRLEWLTIAWMSVEAVVAIASGWVAGSLVLTAFGLDSLIELASAGAPEAGQTL